MIFPYLWSKVGFDMFFILLPPPEPPRNEEERKVALKHGLTILAISLGIYALAFVLLWFFA